MREYETYLFDADGTILDTTELIVKTFNHTLELFGRKKVPRDRIIELIGIPLRPQLVQHLGEMDETTFREIEQEHLSYQLGIHEHYLRACPGTAEVVRELKRRGKRLAVVTSRRRTTLVPYLDAAGFDGLFEVLVTPENTVAHKPDPEPVLYALKSLGVGAAGAVMIGDAEFDIAAGQGAGVDTVFVGWSPTGPERINPPPTHVIERPQELL